MADFTRLNFHVDTRQVCTAVSASSADCEYDNGLRVNGRSMTSHIASSLSFYSDFTAIFNNFSIDQQQLAK